MIASASSAADVKPVILSLRYLAPAHEPTTDRPVRSPASNRQTTARHALNARPAPETSPITSVRIRIAREHAAIRAAFGNHTPRDRLPEGRRSNGRVQLQGLSRMGLVS